MTARQATLDAVDPSDGAFDDAFFDALVGLDRVCRHLAHVIGDASGDALGEASDGARIAEDGAPAIRPLDEPLDEPLDAVLGLVSVRTTVALLLDALRSEPAAVEPAPAAAWSRELLR